MKHATSPHRCDVCASDHQSTDELYTNVNNNSTILSNRQPEIIDLNYDSIDDHSISQTIISSGKRYNYIIIFNFILIIFNIVPLPLKQMMISFYHPT